MLKSVFNLTAESWHGARPRENHGKSVSGRRCGVTGECGLRNFPGGVGAEAFVGSCANGNRSERERRKWKAEEWRSPDGASGTGKATMTVHIVGTGTGNVNGAVHVTSAAGDAGTKRKWPVSPLRGWDEEAQFGRRWVVRVVLWEKFVVVGMTRYGTSGGRHGGSDQTQPGPRYIRGGAYIGAYGHRGDARRAQRFPTTFQFPRRVTKPRMITATQRRKSNTDSDCIKIMRLYGGAIHREGGDGDIIAQDLATKYGPHMAVHRHQTIMNPTTQCGLVSAAAQEIDSRADPADENMEVRRMKLTLHRGCHHENIVTLLKSSFQQERAVHAKLAWLSKWPRCPPAGRRYGLYTIAGVGLLSGVLGRTDGMGREHGLREVGLVSAESREGRPFSSDSAQSSSLAAHGRKPISYQKVFKLLLVVDDIIGAVLSPAPVFLMRCRVTFRGSRNAALGFTTRPVLVTATRARAHRAEHNPTVRTVRIRDARSAAGRRGRATSCSGRRGRARGRGRQADEARAGMVIDASSADEEDGERGEGENEKTGEERERERAAIRKKLEVSRARRRSSMSGTFLIVRGS
ncbi:hypothetical protein JB92DRAFT_3094814 [Gautieria morchelliformis]|nr:hypothetical protein JB92DRAFT_3094814 [Gautieria morchelliformis]